ncbi:MAG TPA: YggT family protein [Clostridia bacterium]|nr:YggT family protein [Clostridia bacterium]
MGLIFNAIDTLLLILEMLVVLRAVISWLPIPRDNQLIDLLYKFTEPMLAPVRKLVEKSSMGNNAFVDFSPLIVLLLIAFVRFLLRRYY